MRFAIRQLSRWMRLANQVPPQHYSVIIAMAVLVDALDRVVATGRLGNHNAKCARRICGPEQRFAYGQSLNKEEYEKLNPTQLDTEVTKRQTLPLPNVICHYRIAKDVARQGKVDVNYLVAPRAGTLDEPTGLHTTGEVAGNDLIEPDFPPDTKAVTRSHSPSGQYQSDRLECIA